MRAVLAVLHARERIDQARATAPPGGGDAEVTAVPAGVAEAGLTIPAYLERLVQADQSAEDELEALAIEGLRSGDPTPVGPGYWEEQHRRLDDRLKKTGRQ